MWVDGERVCECLDQVVCGCRGEIDDRGGMSELRREHFDLSSEARGDEGRQGRGGRGGRGGEELSGGARSVETSLKSSMLGHMTNL